VQKLVDKLKTQKHITIDYEKVEGANHHFAVEMDDMMGTVERYLDRRLLSGR
jgi:alpha/beta superfamily hydrolase